MKLKYIQKYFVNCFLLALSILIWDVVFRNKLPIIFQPKIFWSNISTFIIYGENTSRVLLFILMLLMPLKISSDTQKKGVILYVVGTLAS